MPPNVGVDHPKIESDHTDRAIPVQLQLAVEAMYVMGQLYRALASAKATLQSITEVATGPTGLTLPHWMILTHLLNVPNCPQVDLKFRTNLMPPHLSRLVEELVSRSLVHRYRHPQDRRQSLLALTPAGRKLCMNMLESLSAFAGQEWLPIKDEANQLLESFISAVQSRSDELGALMSPRRRNLSRSSE